MSERSIATSSPISELITHVKHSFRERDFTEVQKILTARESDMKTEIENLTRDRDLAYEKVCSLEREMDLKELERLKLDEKLQKNQRKCEDLEEKVTRLLEEKRLSDDREKRADERCCKLAAENSRLAFEKNKSISELNLKINDLKTKNLQNERLLGVNQEKSKCLDIEIAKMSQEIEESRLKRVEGDRVVEELKGELSKANKSIDELMSKKSESDKAVEEYKSRLSKLMPRLKKIEEDHAAMLIVKVEDLAGLSNGSLKLADLEEGVKLNLPDPRGKNDNSLNDDIVVLPRVACSASSSKCKGPLVSDAHAGGTRSNFGAGRCSKTARSSSAGGEHIIYIDSDDEKNNPAQEPDISNVGENETNFVRSPSSRKQKNRTDFDGVYANSTTKRRKETRTGDANKNNNGLNVEVSTDSDESYTDSKMEAFVASLGSKKIGKNIVYEADMLRAFQEDDELCMNAVCALYRRQVAARKSEGSSNLSKIEGFGPVDSVSGCALAEYLIDGDKDLRLRKTAVQVKKQRPDVINQCRKLSNIYIEKLFEIYRSGKDHLFGQ